MKMRRLAQCLVVAAIALPAPSHQAGAAAADPSALVTAMSGELRQDLADTALTPAVREQRFHDILDDGVDFATISRFVLGRYWQATSEPVRQEFGTVFESYVIQSFTRQFGLFGGETMKVTGARIEGEADTVVATQIVHPNGSPSTSVDWRVHKGANGFKISDVSIGGVSMALTYREQFASVIDQSNGQVPVLIAKLREKVDAQPKTTDPTAGTPAVAKP